MNSGPISETSASNARFFETSAPVTRNSTLHGDTPTDVSAQNKITGAGTSTSNKTKYVAFRDDDIYAQVGALKAVNQVHVDKNVPVTLAIVPHPDVTKAGNQLLSSPTSSYLQTIATNPLFEFALHGYTHYNYAYNSPWTTVLTGIGTPKDFTDAESPYVAQRAGIDIVGAGTPNSEFAGRPYTDQYNVIKQGRDDIKEAFGVTPTTFVPPWNEGDDNTLKAASTLGFSLYSTGWDDFSVSRANLYGINVEALDFGFGWDNYGDWQTGMSDLTQQTDAALNAASGGERFVIGYHFWAFTLSDGSIDPGRIALFAQYIDHLKSRGDVTFTTLSAQKQVQSDPSVSADGSDSLYLFAKGADNALWWKHGTPSTKQWTGWKSLGGYVTSDPAAVSFGTGKMTVFVRGGNGTLNQRSTTDGGKTWSTWANLGGQLLPGTGPTAYAYGSGTADNRTGWFVTGMNHALYHMWIDNAGTHGWEKLGGYLTSSPAAASRGAGMIDVFVRGGNGALYQRSTTNGGTSWSTWANIGGVILPDTAPAVTARAGGYDVFVTGMNHALYQKTWQNGEWSTWTSLDGYLTSSPTATWRSDPAKALDVFVRGGDGAFWWRSGSGTPITWSSWVSIGGM